MFVSRGENFSSCVLNMDPNYRFLTLCADSVVCMCLCVCVCAHVCFGLSCTGTRVYKHSYRLDFLLGHVSPSTYFLSNIGKSSLPFRWDRSHSHFWMGQYVFANTYKVTILLTWHKRSGGPCVWKNANNPKTSREHSTPMAKAKANRRPHKGKVGNSVPIFRFVLRVVHVMRLLHVCCVCGCVRLG